MLNEEQAEVQLEDEQPAEEVEQTSDVVEETNEEETEAETAEEETEEEQLVITIGEESLTSEDEEDFNGKPAPNWVKEMRRENRELKRKQREFEKSQEQQTVQTVKTLGVKPTLESHDYDSEAYEKALDAWYVDKREVDAQNAKAETAKQEQQKVVQGYVDSYNKRKESFKVNDFEDAESIVSNKLSADQQFIILSKMKDPEVMVYALGKSKTHLDRLTEIKDPIDFALALKDLENQMKVSKRKASVEPEKKVIGLSSAPKDAKAQLAKLEAEAEKTGDRTKLIQYRKSLNK